MLNVCDEWKRFVYIPLKKTFAWSLPQLALSMGIPESTRQSSRGAFMTKFFLPPNERVTRPIQDNTFSFTVRDNKKSKSPHTSTPRAIEKAYEKLNTLLVFKLQ